MLRIWTVPEYRENKNNIDYQSSSIKPVSVVCIRTEAGLCCHLAGSRCLQVSHHLCSLCQTLLTRTVETWLRNVQGLVNTRTVGHRAPDTCIIIVNINIIVILPIVGTLNQRGRGTGEPGGRGPVGHLEAALPRPRLEDGPITSVGVDRDKC